MFAVFIAFIVKHCGRSFDPGSVRFPIDRLCTQLINFNILNCYPVVKNNFIPSMAVGNPPMPVDGPCMPIVVLSHGHQWAIDGH